MKARDHISVSLRNLWRIKLRAVLTTAGVVIAIATFVAMLSFAAGNHRYFTTAFNEFGLINQISVRPPLRNANDVEDGPALDADAIAAFRQLPGVKMAYPFATFDVSATVGDTTINTTARVVNADVMEVKIFQRILGGARFSSEDASEAIVAEEFARDLGRPSAELIGERLIVSIRVASIDSALIAAVGDPRAEAARLYRSVRRDSLTNRGYVERVMRDELGDKMPVFVEALLKKQRTVADTLEIVGIMPEDKEYQFRTSPVVIPERTAERLHSAGLSIGSNPVELLNAARDGTLLAPETSYASRDYPRVTVVTEPLANQTALTDSIEAMGFRASSFAEGFEEMQRFMVYFYAGMGVVGLIALLTASLGIINTMIMSITERRREIGILKSLGAHESDIQRLFLVESATIGVIGSLTGLFFGWVGTRIVAQIAKAIMTRQEMPIFDPFALPLWLVATAIGFGVLVSIAAGLYPAMRAAKVDPVEALRND